MRPRRLPCKEVVLAIKVCILWESTVIQLEAISRPVEDAPNMDTALEQRA